ncbi:MAG: DMT family transporter [Gordonia sp. (in: high G+C Gram-positive bacteria)]|uniref:DMT family transporter n=1 Tax=Gordonia sp. (in: high G+C Gram-positive bacteria) TaxID=84139 RepID=UPI0039E512E9
MHTWVPALLAVAAAALIASGTVLRQRASLKNGTITAGWWVGAGIAVLGFGLQAWALGLGSILLVQPLIVLAVLFALPLEARIDHQRPSRADWTWGAILVGSVVLFLIVARPVPTERRPSNELLAATATALVVGLILLVVFAERCRTDHKRALLYGIAAGALFGVAAPLIKAVSFQFIHRREVVLMRPDVYLLVIVIALAIVAQQRAFGAGDIQTSFPAMNVMEPAMSMLLGVVLLGETIQVGVGTAIFLVLVMLVAMIAVAKLAQHSAIHGDLRPRIGETTTADL